MSQRSAPKFNTLTDVMRYLTGGITSRIGQWLYAWGVHPDIITFIGMVAIAVAGYVISQGEFFWAGVVLVVGAPLDALDGAVARAMQRKERFGALFDSTLDRYADGFIFMGLAYYYSTQANHVLVLMCMVAMIGTQLVSYVRARAEGLGLDCKVGLFTRMERMFVILAMLFTGYVKYGVWVLAIGTNITVFQRIWYVYHTMKQQQGDHAA